MAGSLNKVMLMGNLTRDVEIKHLSGENAVGNFGMAVNRKFKARDGDMREEVTFVDCEVWGRTAEVMGQYLSKGRPVFIEGRLKLDTWQDKTDGSNRSKLKVVVDSFQFIDSRNDGGGGGGGGGASRSNESYQSASAPSGAPSHTPVSEDDIPF